MSTEIIERDNKKKKRQSEGSVQPLDGDLSKWIERQFRGGETPQSIDCYPLHKGRDRENRLYHYDVKADEHVGAERSVELANEIFSDCQIHCDRLPRTSLAKEGTKTFEVAIIHDRRGGQASPVGTYLLKLMPRIHAPAPSEDSDDDLSAEDGDGLTARKMILETFKDIVGRTERNQTNMGAIVGDVMSLQKEHIKESFGMIRDLLGENRAAMSEMREMIKQMGQREVEIRAVAIDAENAAVDREFRRAQMTKENMYTDVIRAGMLEGVKVLGALFPGFGQLFHAIVAGKPIPAPPQQLPSANGAATPAQPQLPEAPGEKALVDRFIEAAESHKVDEAHTAAEKLFGKDDASGKPIEPGVFTRAQVAILTGVHMGSLGTDALDALLPDSGKPEAMDGGQTARAMAYLTPAMISDISRCLDLRRKSAAAKKS